VNNTAGQKWWSSTYQWSDNAPDTFTNAQVAGTGNGGVGGVEGDHHDGALFFAGHGLPKYSVFVSGHWDGPATNATNAEVIAEVETLLNYPSTHFFAQCIAVNTFENDIIKTSPRTYGGHSHFLSTNGLSYYGGTINYTANMIAHYPVAQSIGRWGPSLTGAQTSYGYMPGSTAWGGDSTAVHIWTTNWVTPAPTPIVTPAGNTPNMYMSNWAWGNSAFGKISYLCTHQCNTSTYPFTSNTSGVGGRYFYNCLFESPAVSLNVPEMTLTLAGPDGKEVGENITYTVTYQNLSGIAYNATLSLPDPANTLYISSTGGGLHGAGSVTWNLGTLDVGAAGSFNVTYQLLDSSGTGWDARFEAIYYSGQTALQAYSDNVHTSQVVYTPTSTVTATLTSTPSRTPTVTHSPTGTPTNTCTPTGTITLTATDTPTSTATPTITETSTITLTSTETPICTPTQTPTISATSTISATYTISPTFTPTPTATPTLTQTLTSTTTGTPTSTATPSLTVTYTVTLTRTVTQTVTRTAIVSSTPTLTFTPTPVTKPDTVFVYPNPFNPATANGALLKFENLPEGSELSIFTISGELVKKYSGIAGRTTWDGKNAVNSEVAAGVYLYVVNSPGENKSIGKIFLIR